MTAKRLILKEFEERMEREREECGFSFLLVTIQCYIIGINSKWYTTQIAKDWWAGLSYHQKLTLKRVPKSLPL